MVAGPQHFQSSFDPEVTAQREYSLEEIDELWKNPKDIDSINRYQLSVAYDITRLIAQPVPPIIARRNPDGVTALRRNLTSYDDETEDVIAEDPIIQELRSQRVEYRDLGHALRTRRTVVAFLFARGIEIIPTEENPPENNPLPKTGTED